jgi:hypothetical protein
MDEVEQVTEPADAWWLRLPRHGQIGTGHDLA